MSELAFNQPFEVKQEDIPLQSLEYNPHNINEMTDAEFNALCEAAENSGWLPPPTVAPHPDEPGKYSILDGNHRRKAAGVLGWPTILCDVITNLTGEGVQSAQSARMNIVKGTINKTSFTKLWLRARKSHSQQQAMNLFGITSESQLGRLVTLAKRRTDIQISQKGEIPALVARAKTVDDLVTVVRAALGDSGGADEFNYLAFQVRQMKMLLIRVPNDDTLDDLRQRLDALKDRELPHWRLFVEGLTMLEDVPREGLPGPDSEQSLESEEDPPPAPAQPRMFDGLESGD